MINSVIFDMDGVLTDSEPIINAASIEGLREYGVNAKPEDFLPFVGTGDDRYIGGVAELYGRKYFPEMKTRVYEIYLKILPKRIKPFPGVIDLINRLKIIGIKMAVASSSDRIKVEANLQAIGLKLGSFQTIIVGDDVPKKKPAPDIYLVTAEKMHTSPLNCCVIEDAISGITAAKAAGMRCVAVEHSFPSTELIKAKPDRICHQFADITPDDLGLLDYQAQLS
ncbi:MAG: HAD-IA family hydrolase [Kiritimatiellae bacterium]|nr:HAD-IA family hydrolase [Kiritimatiellia bacterium]MDD5520674.1 HAD-IA family hydrolase [Kiritimatiellia bacterium]